MKHSRRDFIKAGSAALGTLAVPMTSPGEVPPGEQPAPTLSASLPPMLSPGPPPSGHVTVDPSEGTAGAYGTWRVTYKVGSGGLKKNGGIQVQLPNPWLAQIRVSVTRLQASDPHMDNYVGASCSREGIKLRTWIDGQAGPEVVLVKTHRRGLDGQINRYIYVTRVWVLSDDLQEGDTLSLTYGDTSAGSRGMLAAFINTGPEPILTAVDTDGTGNFRLHPDRPTLICNAGPAVELLLSGPSTLVRGKAAELLLSVVDANQNPADSYDGEVSLRVTHGDVEAPSTAKFSSGRAWTRVRLVPRATGIVRVQAQNASGTLFARGNPMKVFEQEPEFNIYWGDLHSHTHYSVDAVGRKNFEYARDTSGLDFYAMTDHSCPEVGHYAKGLGPGAPEVWAEYTAKIDKYYEPGKFVTIQAYECSMGAPYGHRNIYFRGRPGPLFDETDATLPKIWAALKAGEALTIPHHTGKMPFPIFWYPSNPEFQRNIEIYSAHGSSEVYDPWSPLSFERSMFTTPSKSVKGPQYAQDAWAKGLELSTIASSDDHRGQPGQPQHGLAAIVASGLTRDEIFEGLYHRRTYGTTGSKILLDFSIDGHPMGQQVRVAGHPRLAIEAHGTNLIELVEVLRYSGTADALRVINTLRPQENDFMWAQEDAFKVIYTLRPQAADFTWAQADRTFERDSIYYMRLREAGIVRNRIVMAWSSPIWVKKA
ncbi:MAG: DUF3604 domain-containing protein [Terriglobia bacterium]